MNKLIFICTMTLVTLTSVFAKNNATLRPVTYSEYPHSFCIQNNSSDTLTIEYVIVDCSGVDQTTVRMYVNTLPFMKKHNGNLRSTIRHKETLHPNESRNLSFVFGERIPASAVTVSVMVSDQLGRKHFICCNTVAQ